MASANGLDRSLVGKMVFVQRPDGRERNGVLVSYNDSFLTLEIDSSPLNISMSMVVSVMLDDGNSSDSEWVPDDLTASTPSASAAQGRFDQFSVNKVVRGNTLVYDASSYSTSASTGPIATKVQSQGGHQGNKGGSGGKKFLSSSTSSNRSSKHVSPAVTPRKNRPRFRFSPSPKVDVPKAAAATLKAQAKSKNAGAPSPNQGKVPTKRSEEEIANRNRLLQEKEKERAKENLLRIQREKEDVQRELRPQVIDLGLNLPMEPKSTAPSLKNAKNSSGAAPEGLVLGGGLEALPPPAQFEILDLGLDMPSHPPSPSPSPPTETTVMEKTPAPPIEQNFQEQHFQQHLLNMANGGGGIMQPMGMPMLVPVGYPNMVMMFPGQNPGQNVQFQQPPHHQQ